MADKNDNKNEVTSTENTEVTKSTRREVDPFDEFGYLTRVGRDFDRLMGLHPFTAPSIFDTMLHNGFGDADPVREFINGDKLEHEFDLPGVSKDDIKLRINDDTLSVSVKTKNRSYDYSINTDSKYDYDKATAKFENGVLTVTVPRLDTPKESGHEITIE